jgi:hypothetical protein
VSPDSVAIPFALFLTSFAENLRDCLVSWHRVNISDRNRDRSVAFSYNGLEHFPGLYVPQDKSRNAPELHLEFISSEFLHELLISLLRIDIQKSGKPDHNKFFEKYL